MAAIRSRGNKATELKLAAMLRAAGITGWRRHQPLPGRPDFIFRPARLAVFVDGCFWHGCPKCYRRPASNRKYWDAKVARNKCRDRLVNQTLRRSGWRVLRIWEHEFARKNEARLVEWLKFFQKKKKALTTIRVKKLRAFASSRQNSCSSRLRLAPARQAGLVFLPKKNQAISKIC